jgi:prepilin-type processing-associated H-X9-DG protein
MRHDRGARRADFIATACCLVLAMWHAESTTLGFADGHAEVHRWHDQSLIEWCEKAMDMSKPFAFIMVPPEDEQTDVTYMAEHFPYESLQ